MRIGFLGGSDSKESVCNAGDLGLIPGSGRSPGEGKGNALQCSCLENSMDRGTWRATVHGVTEWTLLTDSHTHTDENKTSTCSYYSSFPPFETLDTYLSPPG